MAQNLSDPAFEPTDEQLQQLAKDAIVPVHAQLAATRANTTLSDAGSDLFSNGERYLKSARQMAAPALAPAPA